MIGRVTATAVAVAGRGREAAQAGPGGTVDFGEWSPGYPGQYVCQLGGPPYPG